MGEGRVSNRRGGDSKLDKNWSVASDNNEEVGSMIIVLRLEAVMDGSLMMLDDA